MVGGAFEGVGGASKVGLVRWWEELVQLVGGASCV